MSNSPPCVRLPGGCGTLVVADQSVLDRFELENRDTIPDRLVFRLIAANGEWERRGKHGLPSP
jgi:hypothetical protein